MKHGILEDFINITHIGSTVWRKIKKNHQHAQLQGYMCDAQELTNYTHREMW